MDEEARILTKPFKALVVSSQPGTKNEDKGNTNLIQPKKPGKEGQASTEFLNEEETRREQIQQKMNITDGTGMGKQQNPDGDAWRRIEGMFCDIKTRFDQQSQEFVGLRKEMSDQVRES